MKYVALHILLFTLFTLSASGVTFARMKAGEVVAVTDGDTITVRFSALDHKVRLNGIDAPESDQEFGPESKRRLSDLVLGRQVVVVWEKTDRYDRILGTVTLGSTDVGLEQLRAGLAWYFHQDDSNVPEVQRALYVAAETSAKSKNLGLWSKSNLIAPWDWRGEKESLVTDDPEIDSKPASSTRSRTVTADSTRSRTVTAAPTATGARRSYSVQCRATTKRGYQCKRMTRSPNGLCWQHGGN
jgi:endonuclease YncB( thermonuclease family)